MYRMNYPQCQLCSRYQCETCGVEQNNREEEARRKKEQGILEEKHRKVVDVVCACIGIQFLCIWLLDNGMREWLYAILSVILGYLSIIKHNKSSDWIVYFSLLIILMVPIVIQGIYIGLDLWLEIIPFITGGLFI